MIPAGGGAQPPYSGTQQPGFMPVQPQPTGMMPPQQMMPGQLMMQYPAMMPGQQYPAQPPMYNPQMAPGYMLRAPAVAQRCMIPPPQYTPQMAQEFRAKQSQYQKQQGNLAEEQRKKMEQLLKQRQFEDQQKRLKEFSSMGGRKIDATSMIESIIGRTEPIKSHTSKNATVTSQSQNHVTTKGSNSKEDDGFGDFIGGPSGSSKASNQCESQMQNVLPEQPGPSCQSASAVNVQNTSGNQAQPSEQPASVSKEQKKDLMAMMLECSDLSAPQKAKGFVKKSVKEIQPIRKNVVSYQESQKAHKWNQSDETLTELFTLPDGSLPGSVFEPPKWVTGVVPVPEVYTLVLEASIVDGMINTERLYPILLRSNLPRETLGQLWALCNKTTPGQLIKEELYMLLAMVSIAQNNLDYSSLDILMKCPQAPVPNLGQHAPSADQPASQTNANSSQVSSSTAVSTALVPEVVSTDVAAVDSAANGTGSAKMDDDDFSDFQSGPTVVGAAAQSGLQLSKNKCAESFKFLLQDHMVTLLVVPLWPTLSQHSVSISTSRNGTIVGSEIKNSYIQPLSTEKEEREEDIDEYFKNMQALSAMANKSEIADPFKKNSKHRSNVTIKPVAHRLETSFPVSSDTETYTTQSDAAMPDFDNFAAFPSSRSESSSSQSQGWPSSSSISGLTSASSNTDDMADFMSAGTGTPADDFTEFQQAPDVGGTSDKGIDKISALKALIMNKELYSEKPKIEPKQLSAEDTTKEDDWAAFPSADNQQESTNVTSSSDVGSITPVAEPSATMGFFTDSISASVSGTKQNDWAVFVSASKPGPDLTAVISQEMSPVTDTKVEFGDIHHAQQPNEGLDKEEKLKVDKAKSEKLFAKNLVSSSSGLGVPAFSAFDLAPPELPEMKDDDVDEEFDEFGTFQAGTILSNNNGEGISALAMGLDDLPDFNFVAAKSSQMSSLNTVINSTNGKDTSDTLSTASQEFSGWRTQSKSSQKEDTQSMNSLDLRLGHKDESPSSADCQSISSLEFSAGDTSRKSATPQDQRSVASLELKVTSEIGSDDTASTPDVPPGGVDSVEADSSNSLPQPTPFSQTKPPVTKQADWTFEEKPRDVSELLTQGGLPAIGDRYSGLTQEPQDTDKHTYYWQCCLEKCKQVLIVAMETFHTVSKSDIAQEIVNSEKGGQYMRDIVEVYRVFCRIKQAMKCFSISNSKLESLVEVIEDTWASLTIFISNTPIMPERAALDFSKDVLKTESDDNQNMACGVCVLNVNPKTDLSHLNNQHKLTYGGRQYHSSCANFWVNCVDSTLPSLRIPELL